jgi:hypothetical protein
MRLKQRRARHKDQSVLTRFVEALPEKPDRVGGGYDIRESEVTSEAYVVVGLAFQFGVVEAVSALENLHLHLSIGSSWVCLPKALVVVNRLNDRPEGTPVCARRQRRLKSSIKTTQLIYLYFNLILYRIYLILTFMEKKL